MSLIPALVPLDKTKALAVLSIALTDSSFIADTGNQSVFYDPAAANLYKATFMLPQQAYGNAKSLLYQFRPRFNRDSTSPPNDSLSETANAGYADLPLVIVYNPTTRQSVYIGADANARYSADSNASGYTVAYGFLGVQGSKPFYATPNDQLAIYTYQNPNLAARNMGFLNLQFANFEVAPYQDTQGAWLTSVTN